MKIPKWVWIPTLSILLVVIVLVRGFRIFHNHNTKLPSNLPVKISKSAFTTLGSFAIPSIPGWEKIIRKDNFVHTLTYTKNLDNGADVEFAFHYEPTKKGGKSPSVSDIRRRALVMLQRALRAKLPNVTTVGPQLTKFQNWPAYLISIHIDYSKNPQIIDSDDEKVMIFADKTDMYNIAVDFSNAANTSQSRQLADQVWKKMLQEIKPVKINK